MHARVHAQQIKEMGSYDTVPYLREWVEDAYVWESQLPMEIWGGFLCLYLQCVSDQLLRRLVTPVPVRITVEDFLGNHDRVGTTYKQLAQDASPGDRLLVDDGKVGLVVEHVDGPDVVCTVTEGGPVSNNKGLSMPGMNVSVPALSEKDIDDLEFALRGNDYVNLGLPDFNL